MTIISANVSRSNVRRLIGLADIVTAKLAPAAPTLPPLPNLAARTAALVTARNEAEAANDAYESAKRTLVALKAVRDAKTKTLRAEHRAVISTVEAEAQGSALLLSASGYPLAATPQGSRQPGAIQNVTLHTGDAEGTLGLTFDPEGNSRTYEVQISSADGVDGPWTTHAQPTKSTVRLTGLTSGTRVWVRVRGIGSKGPGAWGDPATKIVP